MLGQRICASVCGVCLCGCARYSSPNDSTQTVGKDRQTSHICVFMSYVVHMAICTMLGPERPLAELLLGNISVFSVVLGIKTMFWYMYMTCWLVCVSLSDASVGIKIHTYMYTYV